MPEKKGVQIAYIRAIKYMYDGVTSHVRIQGETIENFPISIRFKPRVNFESHYINLVLDVFTEHIQDPVPKCIFFRMI